MLKKKIKEEIEIQDNGSRDQFFIGSSKRFY